MSKQEVLCGRSSDHRQPTLGIERTRQLDGGEPEPTGWLSLHVPATLHEEDGGEWWEGKADRSLKKKAQRDWRAAIVIGFGYSQRNCS